MIGCPGFIFGTMHVKDGQVHEFVEKLKPYLQHATTFAAEMDLGEVNPLELQSCQRLPDGRHIDDFFSEKKFAKIHGIILKSFGLNLDHCNNLHPFLIIALLAERVMEADQELALDYQLWKEAQQLGLTLKGLESFKDQMEIMEKIPISASIKQLKQVALHPQRFRRQIKKMLDLYLQQDIRMLHKVSKRQLQKLKRVLLYDRNQRMADRILSMAKNSHLFATFGAGHLAGEKGVLRNLKTQGCQLTPIFI